MQFSAKLSGLLMTIAASALLTNASVIESRVSAHLLAVARSRSTHSIVDHPQETAADLSVTFYNDYNFLGSSYTPESIVAGEIDNLPQSWWSRVRSLSITHGYECRFFQYVVTTHIPPD